jgi:hypothetical protein
VSKRNEKPPLADWEVTLSDGCGIPDRKRTIPQSRCKRGKRGWYTFSDETGIIAEFTPGTVLHVRRADKPQARLVTLPVSLKDITSKQIAALQVSLRQVAGITVLPYGSKAIPDASGQDDEESA